MPKKPTYEELEQKIKALEQKVTLMEKMDSSIQEGDYINQLLQLAPQGVFLIDLSGKIIASNQRGAEHLGKTTEEIVGTNLREYFPPDIGENRKMKGIEVIRSGKPLRFEDQIGDLCFNNIIYPILNSQGKVVRLAIYGTDITEYKKAMEALRDSEERYRETVDLLPSIVCEYDTKGRFTYVNNYGLEAFGYTLSDLKKGLYATQLFPPDEMENFKDRFSLLLKGGKTASHEYRLQDKNGSIMYVIANSAPIYKDGKIVGARSSVTPITERKQTEKALKKSEEKYRELADSLPQVVFEMDESGAITYANRNAFDIFGYAQNDFDEGLNALQMLIPEDRDRAMKNIQMGLIGKKLGAQEYTALRKDGSTFPVAVHVSPIVLENRIVGLRGIIIDTTERKKTEEALRESEEKLARSKKMESLGLLAGGVAHDLNNVLSGIISYPELLLLDLPKNSKLRKPIETMQESGHRAVAIVQDLLTVARGVAITKESLNLNEIVENYLFSPEFKKLEQFHPTVTVRTNLDTDLLNINGSIVHLRKVVMNLVSNAAEAMEGSGNIIISTMNCYVDRPIRGYDDVNSGEYAVLSISDGGSGISSDDLERIFEPFYTKKVMGRSGTGLGLAVVWNVVQDHKGYIDVKTNEKGSTFELYFPITRVEMSNKDLSIPIKDFKGDGETILVVDDVENQREISCKMLDTLGYKTKAVSSGEEAVEYLKEHTVDLILLDMIMDPGINGREAYEQIIKIHPNQKAIIYSGFAETNDVKEAKKLGAGQYVKKPLTLEKIGIAVRDELKK